MKYKTNASKKYQYNILINNKSEKCNCLHISQTYLHISQTYLTISQTYLTISQTYLTIDRNPNMKCFVPFEKNALTLSNFLTRYGKTFCHGDTLFAVSFYAFKVVQYDTHVFNLVIISFNLFIV